MERVRTETPRRIVNITDGMLQIRRLQNLADVSELEGRAQDVRRRQIESLHVAVKVIRLAAEDDSNQQLLDTTMRGLKNSDYEMHVRIADVLRQARAVRTTAETIKI